MVTTEEGGAAAPPAPSLPEVYFLRHGESRHNVAMKTFLEQNPEWKSKHWADQEVEYDPRLRDAALTEFGVSQATAVQAAVRELRPTLVVVSPLTRALHTAHEATGTDPHGKYPGGQAGTPALRWHVEPRLREHRFAWCDVGRPGGDLAAEWPHLAPQLGELPAEWWMPEGHDCPDYRDSSPRLCGGEVPGVRLVRERWTAVHGRADELRLWLLKQAPAERILVVGHSVVFRLLTGKWMANCELLRYDTARASQGAAAPCPCAGCYCDCD